MNTCRFCKGFTEERYPLVKYGVRHYAHADCGLKNLGEKFLDKLSRFQISKFPYRAAQEFGLLDNLKARLSKA